MLMYVRLLRSRYIHCRHRHSSRVACCSLLLLYRYLFSLLRFCFFALFHINSFDFIAYPIRIAASSQCFTVTSENNDIKFVHVEMNTFHCFPVALIRFFLFVFALFTFTLSHFLHHFKIRCMFIYFRSFSILFFCIVVVVVIIVVCFTLFFCFN